ncbi:MAG: sensor histidine kinase, partial [Spirochaetia bacterium]
SFLSPLLHDIRLTYADIQSIYITTDIEEIEVSSKQSLPLGIIITELISNSVKYAFEKNDNGIIHISIYKDRDTPGFLCIEVSDNGKGMPSEVADKGKYGFGLTLVEGYTVQFDGSMSIEGNGENDDEGGTTVRVLLKLE